MFRPRTRPVRRPVGAPLPRGAIVGGAAYRMGRRSAEGAQRQAGQEQASADLQAQQDAPPTAAQQSGAQQAGAGDDITTKLTKLGEMAQQGLLTPDEFAAARTRLLSG
jgi:hypothetical protein